MLATGTAWLAWSGRAPAKLTSQRHDEPQGKAFDNRSVALPFDAIPSSEGGVYGGALPEASVYSVVEGTLRQDTTGSSVDIDSYYTLGNAFNPNQTAVVEWRARLLDCTGGCEGAASVVVMDGLKSFIFSLAFNGVKYSPAEAYWTLAVAMDTRQMHTYRAVIPAGGQSFQLFVDGAFRYQGTPRILHVQPEVYFGDGTNSGGNARVEWEYFRFLNPPPPPYAYVTSRGGYHLTALHPDTLQVAGHVPLPHPSYAAAYSPDASRLYVTHPQSQRLSVIDTTTNTVSAVIAVGRTPYAVAVSPDGSRVYVSSYSGGSLLIIDATTNQVVGEIPLKLGFGIAIMPDSRYAYVTNDDPPGVSIIDLTTNTVLPQTIAVGLGPRDIEFSPDGRYLYVACQFSDTLAVVDAATRTVVATVRTDSNPHRLAVSPDGSRVYVTTATPGGTLAVIDTASFQRVADLRIGVYPEDLAVTPDGRHVLITTSDGGVVIVNTHSNAAVDTIAVGPRAVQIAMPRCRRC